MLALFFCESVLVESSFAQRQGRRSRQQTPETVAALENSVPDFTDLTNEKPLDAKPFLDRAVVAPVISAKIARHAERILLKYDANGSGALEQEEWLKMNGAPQSMDLDGNFIITLAEITTHIANFAEGRTIHNPHPVRRLVSTSTEPAQTSTLFKPFSDPPPKPVRRTLPSEDGDTADEEISLEEIEGFAMSEDEDASTEEATDEETLELPDTIASPRGKKYYTPTRGLPEWFVQRDTNGDGQLSLIEFIPSLSNQGIAVFGKLDKNGDGFITPDELPRQQQQ